MFKNIHRRAVGQFQYLGCEYSAWRTCRDDHAVQADEMGKVRGHSVEIVCREDDSEAFGVEIVEEM